MDFLYSLWNKNSLRLAVVSIAVILGLKYLIPFLGPFLPALLFVVFLNPFFNKVQKKIRIPKGILAGAVLLLITLGMTVLLSVIGSALAGYLSRTWELYREYLEKIAVFIKVGFQTIEEQFGLEKGIIEEGIVHEISALWQQMRLVFGQEAMGISYSYLEKGADILLNVTFLVIGILLLVKDYDVICKKLANWRICRIVASVFRRLIRMLWVYVKAQGIVLVCISTVCIAGLWVLGIRNPWFWGILAGLLDVLPFIGAGMVLVPLGVLSALFGNFWALPGSVLLFAIATFIRHLLEPKLIGAEIDVYPVALLFSVFLGLSFYRLGGIVLGPVALFLIKEIYAEVKRK